MTVYFHWSFVAPSIANGSDLPYEFFLMGQRVRKHFGPAADHTLVMEQILPEDWEYTYPVPDACPPCEPCMLNHYPYPES